VFYTDAAFDSKTKILTASCVLYQNTKVAYKTWNLGIGMSIDDAELYAIEKATKWSKTLKNTSHIWIFTDSQRSIQFIEKSSHFLANEIEKTIETMHDIQTHIHWIPAHQNIPGNEKADNLAKSVFNSDIIARDRFISFKLLNDQILEHNKNQWIQQWNQNLKKGKTYESFDTQPGDSKIKWLSKKFTKHVISTIFQLKTGHGYFKSYLIRLPKYDTKKCNGYCNFTQNSKHLLLYCHHCKDERVKLINNMKPQNITLKTLFETKKGIENLANFLINIEIVTRKWILGDLEDNEREETQNE
jgi:ribonuclease HI